MRIVPPRSGRAASPEDPGETAAACCKDRSVVVLDADAAGHVARRTGGGNSYKGFSEPTLEMRPTGNPSIPYVGTLRYREKVYSCSGGGS